MRISIYQILFLFSFYFFINHDLFAQLVVDPTATPEELVENIVDESISYSDIIYYGDTLSSGVFSTIDTTDLGMEEGIILTTGRAILAIGPNDDSYVGYENTLPGHPLLSQVYSAYSYDACGLDFNFIPNNDLILCKTIFGSEEYPESYLYWFEGFGVFFTGSKSDGNYYTDTNTANVPYTPLPINVHNINNTIPSYPELYIDNSNGQYIQYDGFTVAIDLYIYVIPDSTYNVKILTADYGDRYYDSGVFIEKNSFKSVNSTDLLSFCFKASNNMEFSQDYFGIISNDSVFIELPYSTDLSSLVASFSTYPDISVYIDSIFQINDTSINDFSEPKIYTLISPGGTSKDWTILVDYLPNTENEVLEFSFTTENNPNLWANIVGEIIGQQIKIEAPIGTDLSNLIATFSLSENATAYINGIIQQSNITPNNFNDTLIYAVAAENGDICYYFTTTTLVTGIQNLNKSQLMLYPNPAKDFIYIDNAINSALELYNCSGKLLLKQDIENPHTKIPVGHLSSGVYFIQINQSENSVWKKIIIN